VHRKLNIFRALSTPPLASVMMSVGYCEAIAWATRAPTVASLPASIEHAGAESNTRGMPEL
jgi:hypothetical protein